MYIEKTYKKWSSKRTVAIVIILALFISIIPMEGVTVRTSRAATYTGINTNMTLEDGDTLQGELRDCVITIPKDVTVEVSGQLVISGNVTIKGGGRLLRGSSFQSSMISVPISSTLNLGESEGITGIIIDGDNIEIDNISGPAVSVAGTINIYEGTRSEERRVGKEC